MWRDSQGPKAARSMLRTTGSVGQALRVPHARGSGRGQASPARGAAPAASNTYSAQAWRVALKVNLLASDGHWACDPLSQDVPRGSRGKPPPQAARGQEGSRRGSEHGSPPPAEDGRCRPPYRRPSPSSASDLAAAWYQEIIRRPLQARHQEIRRTWLPASWLGRPPCMRANPTRPRTYQRRRPPDCLGDLSAVHRCGRERRSSPEIGVSIRCRVRDIGQAWARGCRQAQPYPACRRSLRLGGRDPPPGH